MAEGTGADTCRCRYEGGMVAAERLLHTMPGEHCNGSPRRQRLVDPAFQYLVSVWRFWLQAWLPSAGRRCQMNPASDRAVRATLSRTSCRWPRPWAVDGRAVR